MSSRQEEYFYVLENLAIAYGVQILAHLYSVTPSGSPTLSYRGALKKKKNQSKNQG